jgi:hypothetical protein
VRRRVSGQEPFLPLQIHTFPHCLQAHALLMSGSQQTVTKIQKNSANGENSFVEPGPFRVPGGRVSPRRQAQAL